MNSVYSRIFVYMPRVVFLKILGKGCYLLFHCHPLGIPATRLEYCMTSLVVTRVMTFCFLKQDADPHYHTKDCPETTRVRVNVLLQAVLAAANLCEYYRLKILF